MAGIALKDQVDLISINGPLKDGCKDNDKIKLNSTRFWIQHNLKRLNHECERGWAVLVERMSFSSLSLFSFNYYISFLTILIL